MPPPLGRVRAGPLAPRPSAWCAHGYLIPFRILPALALVPLRLCWIHLHTGGRLVYARDNVPHPADASEVPEEKDSIICKLRYLVCFTGR